MVLSLQLLLLPLVLLLVLLPVLLPVLLSVVLLESSLVLTPATDVVKLG